MFRDASPVGFFRPLSTKSSGVAPRGRSRTVCPSTIVAAAWNQIELLPHCDAVRPVGDKCFAVPIRRQS
jgi:hypothetical protein